MPSDFKPAKRVKDPACLPLDASPVALREGVRAYGVCPLCGSSGSLNRAHVVPKGQRGDDVPENMGWLCGDGVMGCHGCLTHGNRVIDHPLTPAQVAVRFVYYCRRSMPQLGEYADRAKYPGWLEDYYLRALSPEEIVEAAA